jgi:hypothetical protein
MTQNTLNTLRNTILSRPNNAKTFKLGLDSSAETLLNAANLRDTYTRLQREKLNFKLHHTFDKFSHDVQQLQQGKSHGHLHAWSKEHVTAMNNAIFANKFQEEVQELKRTSMWYTTFEASDYQKKFAIAAANFKTQAQELFLDTDSIEADLNAIFSNPGTEPYMAAKNAAILLLSLESPEKFGEWVPAYVEPVQEAQEVPASEICYDDGEGGQICEPAGVAQNLE